MISKGLIFLYSLSFVKGVSFEEHADYWIPKINEKESWNAGFNEYFSGRTMDEIKHMMGAKIDATEKTSTGGTRSNPSNLPEEFVTGTDRWERCNSTIRYIKDQSICGSCWAVAASEVIADRICIANYASVPGPCSLGLGEAEPLISMSAEELMTCCKFCGHGCDGGFSGAAMEYWAWNGVVTGGSFGSECGCEPYQIAPCPYGPCPDPYTPNCVRACRDHYSIPFAKDKHFAESYYSLPNDPGFLMKEIYNHGSIECSFIVYENFLHYTSGVYDHSEGSVMGGHAIKVIGWGNEDGRDYWLINNSWNVTWGMEGQFKYIRGSNLGGMEAGCVAGIARPKDSHFILQCSNKQ